jgi:hypothetical protein
LDTAVLLLRNSDWSRQFVDEVLSYQHKEARHGDAIQLMCLNPRARCSQCSVLHSDDL